MSSELYQTIEQIGREKGLDTDVMPPVGEAVMSQLGYHIRAGGHDLTEYDWSQYLEFATRHLGAGTVDIR